MTLPLCEKPSCRLPVDKVYATEIRGRIKEWYCENCYFQWIDANKRKEEKRKLHVVKET